MIGRRGVTFPPHRFSDLTDVKSKTESKTNRQFYLAKSDTVIKEENIPKNKLLLTG